MSEFTAKDISLIIRSCKESGVLDFEYQGLKLSFFSPTLTSDEEQKVLVPSEVERDYEPEVKKIIEEEKESQELDELMLTDIVEYEKRLNRI